MSNTRQLLSIVAIAAASFAGIASAAPQSPEAWFGAEPVTVGPALSRAEVQADLNLWNRAGLNQFSGEQFAADTPAYQAKLAEYQRLRSGSAYLAEVRSLGGNVDATATRTANPAQTATLSRAEVQADLNLWSRAGLNQSSGEQSVADTPDYQAKLAQYQSLRSGPAYLAEVRRLSADAGALASNGSQSSAH